MIISDNLWGSMSFKFTIASKHFNIESYKWKHKFEKWWPAEFTVGYKLSFWKRFLSLRPVRTVFAQFLFFAFYTSSSHIDEWVVGSADFHFLWGLNEKSKVKGTQQKYQKLHFWRFVKTRLLSSSDSITWFGGQSGSRFFKAFFSSLIWWSSSFRFTKLE